MFYKNNILEYERFGSALESDIDFVRIGVCACVSIYIEKRVYGICLFVLKSL